MLLRAIAKRATYESPPFFSSPLNQPYISNTNVLQNVAHVHEFPINGLGGTRNMSHQQAFKLRQLFLSLKNNRLSILIPVHGAKISCINVGINTQKQHKRKY
jgi:hypothetical protein